MSNPQIIDISSLPLLKIKNIKGIYFLYKNNDIVYIGQTKNLISRLAVHLADKNKDFDSYKFLELPHNMNLNKLERFLIKKFKPEYNILYKYDGEEYNQDISMIREIK